MTQAFNLAVLANAVNTSGQLNVGTNATGVLPVANGGTGLSATPTNGQLNIGNGSGFTRNTLTQGTGITITNGAGTITIAASGGTGVTSLNGQTGAITNTGVDAIGSYVTGLVGLPASGSGTLYNIGNTVAGSSLRYNFSSSISAFGSTWSVNVGGNVSVGYTGGGTALSGTYRVMSVCAIQRGYCAGENVSTGVWNMGMFVRIS